jgi:hypothetical protein
MMDKEIGYVTIDDVLSLDKSKPIAEILAEEYDRMIAKDIVEVIKKYFPQSTLDEKKVTRLARMLLAEETKKGGKE